MARFHQHAIGSWIWIYIICHHQLPHMQWWQFETATTTTTTTAAATTARRTTTTTTTRRRTRSALSFCLPELGSIRHETPPSSNPLRQETLRWETTPTVHRNDPWHSKPSMMARPFPKPGRKKHHETKVNWEELGSFGAWQFVEFRPFCTYWVVGIF